MIFNYFLHLILLWIAVILTDMDSPGVYKAWYYPCMIWVFQRAQSHPLWNARLPSCSLWLRSRDCGGKSATVSTPWSSLVWKLECKPGVRACLWRMESYFLWVKLQSIVQKTCRLEYHSLQSRYASSSPLYRSISQYNITTSTVKRLPAYHSFLSYFMR